MYGWGAWPAYVKVADKKKKAAKAVAKMNKNGRMVFPVQIDGTVISKTFWGKKWCKHLESFADYASRLERGRSYVRAGSVIHLEILSGKVEALVQGSSLYKVKIGIAAADKKKWESITQKCSGEIGSVIELLQGKLSSSVMNTITDKQSGLFPLPNEINFNCSCPDWAEMCKHVAATLYGVGARLDNEPELLFVLRSTDHMELISKAAVSVPTKKGGKANVILDQDLSEMFGIEIGEKKGALSSVKKTVKAVAPKKVTKKKKIIPKKRSRRILPSLTQLI